MNLSTKINYWIDISDYDLATAEAMLKSKRYLYVGFMCHQTIEKMLKAYYAFRFEEAPPFTHNLGLLVEKTGLGNLMNEVQFTLLDELEPLNIESRYPEYKERLMKQLTKVRCKDLIDRTSIFQKWIKERLSIK